MGPGKFSLDPGIQISWVLTSLHPTNPTDPNPNPHPKHHGPYTLGCLR